MIGAESTVTLDSHAGWWTHRTSGRRWEFAYGTQFNGAVRMNALFILLAILRLIGAVQRLVT